MLSSVPNDDVLTKPLYLVSNIIKNSISLMQSAVLIKYIQRARVRALAGIHYLRKAL